jgi:hypothetical protein
MAVTAAAARCSVSVHAVRIAGSSELVVRAEQITSRHKSEQDSVGPGRLSAVQQETRSTEVASLKIIWR